MFNSIRKHSESCIHNLGKSQFAFPPCWIPPHLFLASVGHSFHVIKASGQPWNCTLYMMFPFSESPTHMRCALWPWVGMNTYNTHTYSCTHTQTQTHTYTHTSWPVRWMIIRERSLLKTLCLARLSCYHYERCDIQWSHMSQTGITAGRAGEIVPACICLKSITFFEGTCPICTEFMSCSFADKHSDLSGPSPGLLLLGQPG